MTFSLRRKHIFRRLQWNWDFQRHVKTHISTCIKTERPCSENARTIFSPYRCFWCCQGSHCKDVESAWTKSFKGFIEGAQRGQCSSQVVWLTQCQRPRVPGKLKILEWKNTQWVLNEKQQGLISCKQVNHQQLPLKQLADQLNGWLFRSPVIHHDAPWVAVHC